MRIAALFAASLSILLFACTNEVVVVPNGAKGSGSRPAGCAETICDVDHERCGRSTNKSSQCVDCELECPSMTSTDRYIACTEACARICETSEVSCTDRLAKCRKSNANQGCVDGMDRDLVPAVLDNPSKFDSEFKCGSAACSQLVPACVELAIETVCKR